MKLRDQMRQDLDLGGYAKGTRDQYLKAVERFAAHVGRAPEKLGQVEVRAYVEHLRNKRKCGASVLKVQMAGIRFLYAVTLGRPEVVAWMSWPRQPAKLPVVLSGSEVEKLLAAMSHPMLRAMAMVMYGAGLRVSEACALQVTDIDAARGLLHVRHGKGNRERWALLPERLLVALRSYWAAARPPLPFLFPSEDATEPMSADRVRTAIAAAVLRDIVRCRTAALGGHLDVCDHCGDETPSYNSCRNRHCPKCQGLAQAKWIAEREERILPVRHFHVVFTLPSELHALTRYRREICFDLLFACAGQTLLELGRDERHLGATLGLTAVLHTWTRELEFHPHVHCIVTGGGLSLDGARWIDSRPKFLFPVKLIGALFRGKFLDRLRKAYAQGAFAGFERFDDPEAFERLVSALARKHWVVYAKRAFGGAEQVYRYLGRYTHRVGIANSRLLALREDAVTFRTKSGKAITIAPCEFLRRFLLHVLPPHFVKMRHFGLLASGNVPTKLVQARSLLSSRSPSATATAPSGRDILAALAADESRRCPRCGVGILRRGPIPLDWTPTVAVLDSS